MELLFIVVGLVIAMPVFALVAFIKVQSLEKRVGILTKKVAELSLDSVSDMASAPGKVTEPHMYNDVRPSMKSILPNPISEPASVDINTSNGPIQQDSKYQHYEPNLDIQSSPDESLESSLQLPVQSTQNSESIPTSSDQAHKSTQTSDWVTQLFERWMVNFKENWLVWVGGIALVIGVAYLIEVVGANFAIPLYARVVIAILVSCSVIGAGEWLHRKLSAIDGDFFHHKADAYIPAAVYGSGLSGLYGTIIFSSVIQPFLSPLIALSLMALLAAVALALTQRLGPLMAVLGLFGGYTAPIWVGGAEPNFILLTCYITSITIAGIWVQQLTRISWLTFGIIALHSLWLMTIVNAMAQIDLLLWFLLFIPFTTYLLVFVPQMGWQLHFKCKYRTRAPFFYATIPAIILGLITLFLVKRTPNVGSISLFYYLYPMLLLFTPSFRKFRSPRSLTWLNIVAVVSMFVVSDLLLKAKLGAKSDILLMTAGMILLVLFRTTGQYWQGDKSVSSYWQAVLLAPLLMIGSLLYIDYCLPEYRSATTIFVVVGMLLLVWIAARINALSANLSAITHALLLTICLVYSDGGELTLLIALQMLMMTLQYQRNWLAPNLLGLKLLGTLIVLRQSILPFWPELQALPLPQWTWLLATILPSLMAFVWIRYVLRSSGHSLAEWFDAAMLHLAVILIFAQTNYLFLEDFNFLAQFEFENIAIFACQGLALAGVYQLKANHSRSLNLLYRGYSVFLVGAATLCVIFLNTQFQPLQTNYVLGSDWPVFNWLSIGWLIPGLLVIGIARMKVFPEYTRWLLGAAFVLIGLWVVFSIRQFWQQGALTYDMPTSMAELFSYSVALILVGVATSYYGLQREHRTIQSVGFAMLGVAVCKVFLWDAAELEGLWRAVSFIGLGGCLISLGWLYQRLSLKSDKAA
ncbi:DUF2339 domain-containing protein [Vibrio splendidus]